LRRFPCCAKLKNPAEQGFLLGVAVSDKERGAHATLAAAVAGLKAVGDLPDVIRGYVAGVVAESERDLAAERMGPRRGRSIFQLHRGAWRALPELADNDEVMGWLEFVNLASGQLPDYFPWRFDFLAGEEEPPLLDASGTPRGDSVGRWGAGSWQVKLLEEPLSNPIGDPFVTPALDALAPEGWWWIDRSEILAELESPGERRFAAGSLAELALLRVAPGDEEAAGTLGFGNPGFNKELHLLAVRGEPKPSFGRALAALVDEALAEAPHLTVAEAVLRGLWQAPSRDMAAQFEAGRFQVAASTGYGGGQLWVTEPL
jgi:hypothetical protein